MGGCAGWLRKHRTVSRAAGSAIDAGAARRAESDRTPPMGNANRRKCLPRRMRAGAGAVLLVGCLVLVDSGCHIESAMSPGREKRGISMADVLDGTRLQEIVFFREGEGQRKFDQRHFLRGRVVQGAATGTLGDADDIMSAAAAKDGQLGLRLEVIPESADTAWRLEIIPEKKESYEPKHAPPYFDVYAYRDGGTLEFDLRGEAKGKGLAVTFRSSRRPQPDPVSLDPYLNEATDWQHVVMPVKDFDMSNPESELVMADRLVVSGSGWAGPLRIDLDNVVLRSDGPEPERGPVRVDHVGYIPGQQKVGLVGGSCLSEFSGRPFVIRRADEDGQATGRPVFEGKLVLRQAFEPKIYGEWLYGADFTPVEEPGRYILEVPGVGSSVPFYVNEAVYDYLYYHLARFFFYQRNGGALPPKNAFEWARGEIYTRPTPYLSDPSKTRIIRHGWFDAGDSRLYPHTDRVGPLLLAWEMCKGHNFDGQLNLPESGNGIPDILDEIRYHVEYLREVQRDDGSCPGYTMTGEGNGNPVHGDDRGYENDDDPRFIHDTDKPRGGLQTGAICACFAMLARNLKPYDAARAKLYEDAADRAWAWLEGPGRETSLSPSRRADRLWAAVEMWRLTREDRYREAVRDFSQGEVEEAWDGYAFRERKSAWIAWFSYALDEDGDRDLREAFRRRILDRTETLFAMADNDPYHVDVNTGEFYFGIGDLGRTAGLLAMVWKLTGDDRYRELAEDHLHYICGRNVYRLCGISNVAPESHGEPFHMLEWLPGRTAWMPGYVMYMSINSAGTLSRFKARRLRVSRHNYWFSEPCVGFNFGPTVAAMILMDGKRYPDLIQQGALPGVKPFRPGLPFAPSTHTPWGDEPVIPDGDE
jgi:hypothetical protein